MKSFWEFGSNDTDDENAANEQLRVGGKENDDTL